MNQCPAGTQFPVDSNHPDPNSPYQCSNGPIGASTSTFSVMSLGGDGGVLMDMTEYVVAVAAYDEVYNVGPLSGLLCAAPQQTNTFLKTYCEDGGPGCAGCGSCNVGARNDPLWPMLGFAALGGVVVIVRRDRRQRRRRMGIG